MSIEPIAWVDKLQTFVIHDDYLNLPPELQKGMTPLYKLQTIPNGCIDPKSYYEGYKDGIDTKLQELTEDECEEIINKHDWFSKSWHEMAKEIHDAILRKASK